jgi:hypothetical protein
MPSAAPRLAAAAGRPPRLRPPRRGCWSGSTATRATTACRRWATPSPQLSGVPVVVQHPEGAPDKFQAAAGAGKGPDIFCWPHDRAGEWAKSGLIVPSSPGRPCATRSRTRPGRPSPTQGKVWGYPLSIEAIGLIYNKALVKTPPATFDEVIAARQAAAGAGQARHPVGLQQVLLHLAHAGWARAASSSAARRKATTTRRRWASTPLARCRPPDAGAPDQRRRTCPAARATPRWKAASHAARWR